MIEVFNPYDRSFIGALKPATAQEIERVLAQAAALTNPLPKYERLAILERLRELMRRDFEKLLQVAIREGGKPYVDTKVEIERAILGVGLAISELQKLGGQEIPMGITPGAAGRFATTILEPLGLTLAISAFNHPLNLIVHQVVPAVAVGAPVIIKPALTTPYTCLAFVELLAEAGLPAGWVQAVICTNDLAEQMVSDKRVRFFSFIGSERVGWYLGTKLAAGTGCVLEHGGAAPVIFGEDVDALAHIPSIAKGGFYHAGQVCVSVQRVYLPQQQARAFADALAAFAQTLITGDPQSPQTDVGPMITPQELQRVHQWVNDARAAGAICLSGGQPLSETCYPPTVLLDPPDDANVSTLEIFGPVVCVYGYQTVAEAVARANALPFCFQAAFFTNQLDTAFYATKALKANTVLINDHTAFRVDWMPFGGNEHSGIGRGGIGYAMRDLLKEKLIIFRTHTL